MHASSYENMQCCYDAYVRGGFLETRASVTVVDLGSADVNGTYRSIFNHAKVRYVGVDLAPGAGVDLLLDDPYRLPLPDASADIVLSGQMLEHCEFFWQAFQEMIRILKPDGLLFLIAPSAGQIHRFPVDCYRFYPDAYQALAKYANCTLLNVWRDERGPWNDLVGVFSGRDAERRSEAVSQTSSSQVDSACDDPLLSASATPAASHNPSQEAAVMAGSGHYRNVLKLVHAELQPKCYLEIGVDEGQTLALAANQAIGVDPAPRLTMMQPSRTKLFQETSDLFFRDHANSALSSGVDLAFVDGMHRFEYALRDFMNVERHSHLATVVVFDDIYPNHPLQAARRRQTNVWTGDVWKVMDCLQKYRPDLLMVRIDAWPTGLLIVAGLDKNNGVLRDSYDSILNEFVDDRSEELPTEVIDRTGAFDPDDPRLAFLLHELHGLRSAGALGDAVRQRLREWCVALFPPIVNKDEHARRRAVRSANVKERRIREQVEAMSQSFAGVHESITPQQLAAMQHAYANFMTSKQWTLSWQLRRFRAWIAPFGTKRWQLARFVIRSLKMWNRESLRRLLSFVRSTVMNRLRLRPSE